LTYMSPILTGMRDGTVPSLQPSGNRVQCIFKRCRKVIAKSDLIYLVALIPYIQDLIIRPTSSLTNMSNFLVSRMFSSLATSSALLPLVRMVGLKTACSARLRLRADTDSAAQAAGSTVSGALGLIMYLDCISEREECNKTFILTIETG
jgi:hypothetical protein